MPPRPHITGAVDGPTSRHAIRMLESLPPWWSGNSPGTSNVPSRTLMSVASATRVFAAGTTAEDTLCRCVTGKDSSVAFIESSAKPWHGLTGLLRSAHLLRRVVYVLPQA